MIGTFIEHLFEHLKLTREDKIPEYISRLTPSKLIIYALESQRRDCKMDPKDSHNDPTWITLKIECRHKQFYWYQWESCRSVKTQVVHNLT